MSHIEIMKFCKNHWSLLYEREWEAELEGELNEYELVEEEVAV
jgi:hypothetical protein